MAQDWYYLLAGDTLTTSYPLINDSLRALRTSFSGASGPLSPREGQPWLNTTTNGWYMTPITGTTIGSPTLIFYANKTYGGLLPLTAGSGYKLTDDLYFGDTGGHKICNLRAPALDTDAETHGGAKTLIAAHAHGGGADGLKVPFTYLSGIANDTLVGASNGTVVGRKFAISEPNLASLVTAGIEAAPNPVASVDVAVNAQEIKWIMIYVMAPYGGTIYPQFKVYRNTTCIQAYGADVTTMPGGASAAYYAPMIFFLYDRPATAATYTYHLHVAANGGGSATWQFPRIMVW
jgi:hypothetical protein